MVCMIGIYDNRLDTDGLSILEEKRSMMYKKNKMIESTPVDDFYVAFVGEDLNNPIIINGIARDILNFCDTPKNEEMIISYVLNAYDCSDCEFQVITGEISSCLVDMLKADLLIECREEGEL